MRGTVIKRGSKWSVVIDAGRDPEGNRIRKWHSGYSTKKEAEAARIEILGQLQSGVYMAPTKVTVAEWLSGWLDGRVGLADTTMEGYRRDAKRVIDGYNTDPVISGLGPIRVRELTPASIRKFYKALSDRGLAPATVKNTHAVLHKALSDAVREGVLVRNPADQVELPKANPPDTDAWTADQLASFLAKASDHRLYAAWVLMCSTGMRRSEVLGARWTNLDLDQGRIAVVDTVVPVANRPVLRLGDTKSRRSRRVIALDQATVKVLTEHRKRQNVERLRAGEAWEDLDLVFANELGEMVVPTWFTRTTKRLAGEAGVPALTPHAAARHTWATLALSAGIPAKVVSERLGHSTVAITLDRYSHVVEGMDRDAAERVASLIEQASR